MGLTRPSLHLFRQEGRIYGPYFAGSASFPAWRIKYAHLLRCFVSARSRAGADSRVDEEFTFYLAEHTRQDFYRGNTEYAFHYADIYPVLRCGSSFNEHCSVS